MPRPPRWVLVTTAVILFAILIAGVTLGVVVTAQIKAAGTRWAAVGAVLAGGALYIATFGLPLAIQQLVAVERDLARLTRASETEDQLLEHMRRGTALALQWREPHPEGVAGDLLFQIEEGLVTVPTYEDWIRDGAALIRETTDVTEERFFLLAGADAQPRDQLDAKLAYIRNDLMPKVRAGFWADKRAER